jgi:bifunctional DNA-binding transcriptional regulator/antitoxin component of YhaV-PrlF toxin-antitoxin module
MLTFDDIGIAIPEIYLPRAGTDLQKWAVIACDQFTSEPEYWRQVRELVADAPSTLNLVFPEIDLEAAGKDERIRRIQQAMHQYLHNGLLTPREGIVYVERRFGGRMRKGLLLCLDLERYDYSRGSSSLIRATEGTIVERLPPRMAIREGAALELPHILVLIDDPDRTVIEPVQAATTGLEELYDFELMLGSGHLTGYGLSPASQNGAIAALRNLAKPARFRDRYGLKGNDPVLLFAMGDGNHSLATAKAVWEKMKSRVGLTHPARYALVEIENVHDEGLTFEPIHRVVFGIAGDLMKELGAYFSEDLHHRAVSTAQEMLDAVDAATDGSQVIGLVRGDGADRYEVLHISNPKSNLAVGTLQAFLDGFMQRGGASKIDYVHGSDVVERLGAQPGNAGFYLPRMGKSSLFKTVILDGALPRKTFSMGEAREKRFYMEARKIA